MSIYEASGKIGYIVIGYIIIPYWGCSRSQPDKKDITYINKWLWKSYNITLKNKIEKLKESFLISVGMKPHTDWMDNNDISLHQRIIASDW